MQKEWDDKYKNGNFYIIKRDEVPEGSTILPTVCQMQRKKYIKTGKVNKYKAIIKAKVHFRVVEDNSGTLKTTRINKCRPCTKHLNNRLYHFRSYVDTTN